MGGIAATVSEQQAEAVSQELQLDLLAIGQNGTSTEACVADFG